MPFESDGPQMCTLVRFIHGLTDSDFSYSWISRNLKQPSEWANSFVRVGTAIYSLDNKYTNSHTYLKPFLWDNMECAKDDVQSLLTQANLW